MSNIWGKISISSFYIEEFKNDFNHRFPGDFPFKLQREVLSVVVEMYQNCPHERYTFESFYGNKIEFRVMSSCLQMK